MKTRAILTAYNVLHIIPVIDNDRSKYKINRANEEFVVATSLTVRLTN
jgi:hypothetical protein